MSDWREMTLGDLCERVTVGHVGKMSDRYVDDGIPFLRSQNVKPFVIERDGMLQVDEDFHRKLAKSSLAAGDVVVVRTGYPGTAAVVPRELDGSNCADLVVITPGENLNPHLLAAVFNSAWGHSAVSGHLVGAAQQHFNIGSAKTMRLRLPAKPEQDRIAEVLCAFHDLIENNRRRVEVLEEMARAIYREWFVRFRYPGHEGVPLVDSPLGPIPDGWHVEPLFDVAEVAFGFSFKSKRFADRGPFPVVRIRDVPKGTTQTFTDEDPGERYRVVDGDVLIGMDGDFHLHQWSGGIAWLNQRVTRLRPRDGLSARHLLLAVDAPIREWNAAISGTTVAHLGKRHLEQVHVLMPKDSVLKRATDLFDDISQQALTLTHAARRLADMRDLLLPKLVTGQIDVSHLDLDALTEAATA